MQTVVELQIKDKVIVKEIMLHSIQQQITIAHGWNQQRISKKGMNYLQIILLDTGNKINERKRKFSTIIYLFSHVNNGIVYNPLPLLLNSIPYYLKGKQLQFA